MNLMINGRFYSILGHDISKTIYMNIGHNVSKSLFKWSERNGKDRYESGLHQFEVAGARSCAPEDQAPQRHAAALCSAVNGRR